MAVTLPRGKGMTHLFLHAPSVMKAKILWNILPTTTIPLFGILTLLIFKNWIKNVFVISVNYGTRFYHWLELIYLHVPIQSYLTLMFWEDGQASRVLGFSIFVTQIYCCLTLKLRVYANFWKGRHFSADLGLLPISTFLPSQSSLHTQHRGGHWTCILRAEIEDSIARAYDIHPFSSQEPISPSLDEASPPRIRSTINCVLRPLTWHFGNRPQVLDRDLSTDEYETPLASRCAEFWISGPFYSYCTFSPFGFFAQCSV